MEDEEVGYVIIRRDTAHTVLAHTNRVYSSIGAARSARTAMFGRPSSRAARRLIAEDTARIVPVKLGAF